MFNLKSKKDEKIVKTILTGKTIEVDIENKHTIKLKKGNSNLLPGEEMIFKQQENGTIHIQKKR